jgi:hypothetical protein
VIRALPGDFTVENSKRGLISMPSVDANDDLVDELIEHNPAFRTLLARCLASPGEPYPFIATPERDLPPDHSSS